jgi:hypothetical protein
MRSEPNTQARVVPYKDHPDPNVPALITLGCTDVIENGDFADSSAWIVGAGRSIAGGKITKTPGAVTSFYQVPPSQVAGKSYIIVFTIADRTAGTIQPQVGAADGTSVSANGTYAEIVAAGVASGATGLLENNTFDGSVDDVAVYNLTGTDPGIYSVIKKVNWSYDAAPTGGAIDIVTPDGLIWGLDITASGKDKAKWPDGIYGARGDGIAVLLQPGGAGISGKLNLLAHSVLT